MWRNTTELVTSLSPACVCRAIGSLAGKRKSGVLHLQQRFGRQACYACVGAALKLVFEVWARDPHDWEGRLVQFN